MFNFSLLVEIIMSSVSIRVAVVGDSFVANDFGTGSRHVPPDQRILHLFSLDEKVLKAGPPPVVDGFGVSGLSVRDDDRWERVIAPQLSKFRPDLVVVFCGGNDFYDKHGVDRNVSGRLLFRSCKEKMEWLLQSLLSTESEEAVPKRPQIRWAFLHPRRPNRWSPAKAWMTKALVFNEAAQHHHRDGRYRSISNHPCQFVPRKHMCYAVEKARGSPSDEPRDPADIEFLARDGVHPDPGKKCYRRVLFQPTRDVYLAFLAVRRS